MSVFADRSSGFLKKDGDSETVEKNQKRVVVD